MPFQCFNIAEINILWLIEWFVPSVDIINSSSAVCLIKGESEMQELAPYHLMVNIHHLITTINIWYYQKILINKRFFFLYSSIVNHINFEKKAEMQDVARDHLNDVIVNHYGRSNMYANTRGGCSHALESAPHIYLDIQHSIFSDAGQERKPFLWLLSWRHITHDTSPPTLPLAR